MFTDEAQVGAQHQEQVEAGDTEQAEAHGQPAHEHGPGRIAEPLQQ
ncbi:MAG: hypothetical protein ACRC2H_10270 [Silanimonas sp.]